MRIRLAVLIVSLVALAGCDGGEAPAPADSSGVGEIGGKELHRILYADLAPDGKLDDFLLIDARPQKDHLQRAMPGAINISYVGCEDEFGRYDFENPLTGKKSVEALTFPDGTPIPKDFKIVFYSNTPG